jgi:hypothetical protein
MAIPAIRPMDLVDGYKSHKLGLAAHIKLWLYYGYIQELYQSYRISYKDHS